MKIVSVHMKLKKIYCKESCNICELSFIILSCGEFGIVVVSLVSLCGEFGIYFQV